MNEEIIRAIMKWIIIIGFVAWGWVGIRALTEREEDKLIPMTLDMGKGVLIENKNG